MDLRTSYNTLSENNISVVHNGPIPLQDQRSWVCRKKEESTQCRRINTWTQTLCFMNRSQRRPELI